MTRKKRNSSLLDVDPFLMLAAFALDTNNSNIKLDKSIHLSKTPDFLTVAKVCFKSFVTLIMKLYNFFNIGSRGIIKSVVERF